MMEFLGGEHSGLVVEYFRLEIEWLLVRKLPEPLYCVIVVEYSRLEIEG